MAVACGADDDTSGTAGMLGTTGDVVGDAGAEAPDGGATSDDPRPGPPPPDPTTPRPPPPPPDDGGMTSESGGSEVDSGSGSTDARGTQPTDSGVICDPSPVLDLCDQCVQTRCCAEWLACTTYECAGDASSLGETICIVQCMDNRFFTNGFVDRATDLSACAAACAVGSELGTETDVLLSCITDLPGDGAPSNCGAECLNLAE